MNIMIDGMGGDHAPEEIVKGAVQAAKEISGTVSIIGREERINECLQALNWNGDNIEVVNATEVISNNESPAMAVRKKKDSSISKGMRMLKEGEVDAFISGGSTGALLSAGLLILGRIRGINDTSLILDCGANAESRPEYLLQYGIMGSIFVEKVKGIENPEVMLLNVGAEEEKGDPLHKGSFELLRNADINFKGNCEGRDVPFGCCDVVVTDGFSGNVFLKSSEGVALAVMKRIKQKMTEGLVAKAGALLSYNKLKEIKKEFDYSEEGGAPILGLKGPVLKIHGSSKANAVYNAILKAVPYVEQDVTALIENAITEKSSGEE